MEWPVSKQLFQKIYFTENKVNLHVFKVPVFMASLTEPLLLCVFDYYRKIKENSHSLLATNKKLEILLNIQFQKMKKESSNKVYVKTKLI